MDTSVSSSLKKASLDTCQDLYSKEKNFHLLKQVCLITMQFLYNYRVQCKINGIFLTHQSPFEEKTPLLILANDFTA